jgi:hypothetical protein
MEINAMKFEKEKRGKKRDRTVRGTVCSINDPKNWFYSFY